MPTIHIYFCHNRQSTCSKMNRLTYIFLSFIVATLFVVFVYHTSSYVTPDISFLSYKDASRLKPGLPVRNSQKNKRPMIRLNQQYTFRKFRSKTSKPNITLPEVEESSSSGSIELSQISGSKKRKPQVVIILARMRTGSTFCGEIFNQNPDMFFLFEPLHSTDKYIRANRDNNRQWRDHPTMLLTALSKCIFSNQYILDISRWSLGRVKSSGIAPVCRISDKCRKVEPKSLTLRCNSFDTSVLKLIRGDLKMVEVLVTKLNIDVKIIHLIRDPRGTAASRKSYYNKDDEHVSLRNLYLLTKHPPKKVNTIVTLCEWMKETTEQAVERPPWMEGRYKMVRYEDLAINPTRLSKDIYDFVGVEMHKKVKAWIKENTEADNENSKNQFSTRKNSSAAATSWRDRLTFEEVEQVQELCGDVMAKLGYEKVQSEKDLKDKNKVVFHPLLIGEDISLT